MVFPLCRFFSSNVFFLFSFQYLLRMIIRKRDGGATEDFLSSFFFCHLVLKMKLCPYDENTKSGRKKVKHPKFTFKDTHFFTENPLVERKKPTSPTRAQNGKTREEKKEKNPLFERRRGVRMAWRRRRKRSLYIPFWWCVHNPNTRD